MTRLDNRTALSVRRSVYCAILSLLSIGLCFAQGNKALTKGLDYTTHSIEYSPSQAWKLALPSRFTVNSLRSVKYDNYIFRSDTKEFIIVAVSVAKPSTRNNLKEVFEKSVKALKRHPYYYLKTAKYKIWYGASMVAFGHPAKPRVAGEVWIISTGEPLKVCTLEFMSNDTQKSVLSDLTDIVEYFKKNN